MQKLYIQPTRITPEINFSPDENAFSIRGTSAPEDVRSLYYPVIDWFRNFSEEILATKNPFTEKAPLRFIIDLSYFNSSSAKFLYDLLTELKHLMSSDVHVVIEWHYDEDDLDLRDAGADISAFAGVEFIFVGKGHS